MTQKTMFAAGAAIAGALALAGCATVEQQIVEKTTNTYTAVLTGDKIVASRGDPDGYAQAQLSVSDTLDKICYDIHDFRNLGPINSITISRAAQGRTGPVVMTLKPAPEGGWKNCLERREWLEDSIRGWTEGYYMTIFTSDYPSGAVRGNFYDTRN